MSLFYLIDFFFFFLQEKFEDLRAKGCNLLGAFRVVNDFFKITVLDNLLVKIFVIWPQVLNACFPVQKKIELYLNKDLLAALQWTASKY